MVLPYINMHPPRVYTCSPSWTPLPPPSPYHPSGSSQCTKRFYFKVTDIRGRAVEMLVALVSFSPFIVIFHTQFSVSFLNKKICSEGRLCRINSNVYKATLFFWDTCKTGEKEAVLAEERGKGWIPISTQHTHTQIHTHRYTHTDTHTSHTHTHTHTHIHTHTSPPSLWFHPTAVAALPSANGRLRAQCITCETHYFNFKMRELRPMER